MTTNIKITTTSVGEGKGVRIVFKHKPFHDEAAGVINAQSNEVYLYKPDANYDITLFDGMSIEVLEANINIEAKPKEIDNG